MMDFREVFPYISNKNWNEQILRALRAHKILPQNRDFRKIFPPKIRAQNEKYLPLRQTLAQSHSLVCTTFFVK